MAAEWIKFDKSTLDKPEVLAIAASLNQDPDFVIGKLLRMWSWFDTHTVSGNAPCVTAALLDSILRVTGFVSEVAKVGWLVIDSDGISLPHFDRHNGETAKQRALTAKRVAGFKASNAKGNGEVTRPALPRKEKKREDKKDQEQKLGRASAPVLPEWLPADAWADWHAFRNARKGWTPKARALSLRTLTELHAAGHDPRRVIEQSIERGWTGLFPLHDVASTKPPMAQQFADKTYTGTPDDELPDFLRADAR
jgi:hypothetical protein